MRKEFEKTRAAGMRLMTIAIGLMIFVANVQTATLGNHLDASFSSDGKITRRVGGTPEGATDSAIQADGKIVVVGTINTSGMDFIVARYNWDGTIDASFGESGSVTTNFGAGDDRAHAVAIQADGKIVVGGFANVSASQSGFALARYNSDGSLDTSFGGDGKVTSSFADNSGIYDIAFQPDGKIVAAGVIISFAQPIFAVARYTTSGLLDTSFSGDGAVFTSTDGYANAVAIQPNGKIVAAGGFSEFEIARYNTDGSPDSSFGAGGKVATPVGNSAGCRGVALQTDGKIVATGTSILNSQSRLAVVRYNPDGSLDQPFASFGKFTYTPDPTIQNAFGRDVVIQPDGKIVTIGRMFFDTAVIRINSNGTRDQTFGNDGVIQIDFGSDALDQALSISIGPNNKLVVTAFTEISGNLGFGIARLSTNLSVPRPAADFDGDGISDLAVFRPSNGAWYVHNSYSNTFTAFSFGLPGDVPVDGDFNGDDRNDFAVFRPSNGVWYLTYTSNNQFSAKQFGSAGDIPLAGDYDRDSKTDVAVWRPSEGNFYVLRSSDSQWTVSHWGANGDIPIGAQ